MGSLDRGHRFYLHGAGMKRFLFLIVTLLVGCGAKRIVPEVHYPLNAPSAELSLENHSLNPLAHGNGGLTLEWMGRKWAVSSPENATGHAVNAAGEPVTRLRPGRTVTIVRGQDLSRVEGVSARLVFNAVPGHRYVVRIAAGRAMVLDLTEGRTVAFKVLQPSFGMSL